MSSVQIGKTEVKNIFGERCVPKQAARNSILSMPPFWGTDREASAIRTVYFTTVACCLVFKF